MSPVSLVFHIDLEIDLKDANGTKFPIYHIIASIITEARIRHASGPVHLYHQFRYMYVTFAIV